MGRFLIVCMSLVPTACGADDKGQTSAADTAPVEVAPETAQDAEPTDSPPSETTPDTVGQPSLPPIDNVAPFLPGEALDEIRVQPGLAWDLVEKSRLVVTLTGKAGDALGIFAGAFDIAGSEAREVAPMALVNAQQSGLRNESSICALQGGGYIVAWSVDTQSGDGKNLQVAWRALDADGVAVGLEETVVATDRPGNHWLADLACRPSGGFVLAGVRPGTGEAGFEVFFQRYDADSAPEGEAVSVLPRDVGGQAFPAVAVGLGDAVWVAWEDTATAQAPTTIVAREFGTSGSGNVLSILSALNDDAQAPVLAAHATGDVLVGGVLGSRLRLQRLSRAAEPAPIPLPETGNPVTTASAVVAVDDGFELVYYRGTGADVTLRHSRLRGEAITAATSVANGSFPLAYRPALAVAGARGAVAWTESLGGGRFVVSVAPYATGEGETP